MSDAPLNALISRMARGDEAAVADLYDRTSFLVFGLCRRILGDAEAAEEAAHDVYLQAWRQAAAFDARRGSAEAWLLMMARARAIDRRRARSAADATISADLASSAGRPFFDDGAGHEIDRQPSRAEAPDTAAARSERGRLIRAALERVTADEREVLDFAFFGGLSHREIASRTHAPLGTVKSRLRSGMFKLRQILQPIAAGSGS